jgi:RimJ/RimL family protein N-acetyltransferase
MVVFLKMSEVKFCSNQGGCMSCVAEVGATQHWNVAKNISFEEDDQGLHVKIETERLLLESTSEKCCDDYEKLFGDQQVMRTFASGETWDRSKVEGRIRGLWAKRWHNKDPYSGFAVFLKEGRVFIGHVTLGHGDDAGEAEIAYLFHKAFWNQGYGKEAVNVILKDYAPETVRKGFKLEGKKLYKVILTTHPKNIPSVRIAERAGMTLLGIQFVEQYKDDRAFYIFDVKP